VKVKAPVGGGPGGLSLGGGPGEWPDGGGSDG